MTFLTVLVVVLSVIGLFNAIALGYALSRLSHVASENRAVACAQKRNAQAQVEASADFLASHPGAEPIPNVTRDELIQQLERQRTYRDSFNALDCPT